MAVALLLHSTSGAVHAAYVWGAAAHAVAELHRRVPEQVRTARAETQRAGEPALDGLVYTAAAVVAWHVRDDLVGSLLVPRHESVALAVNAVALLVQAASALTPLSERSDELTALVHALLPHGQLLVLTEGTVKALRKEADALLR